MKNIEDFLSEIYFNELESREKIFNRIQLNFVIYTTIIAILAYMARMIDYESNSVQLILFYLGLFFSIVLIIISIYFSVISLTGYRYELFSKATEVIEYKSKWEIKAKEFEKYNQDYNLSYEIPNPNIITNEFIVKRIAKCIDKNFAINEIRRKRIQKSIWFMSSASIPIIFSTALFVFYDLDTSSPRKNLLIEDRNLAIEVKKIDVDIKKLQTIIENGENYHERRKRRSNTTSTSTPIY